MKKTIEEIEKAAAMALRIGTIEVSVDDKDFSLVGDDARSFAKGMLFVCKALHMRMEDIHEVSDIMADELRELG